MPSTRRQKAKARRSREMDMMSDFDNLDVMVGSDNINPIEKKLPSAVRESSVQIDTESNLPAREDFFKKMSSGIRTMEIIFPHMNVFWNH